MKQILFAFVGQPRTFEKTYQNIFDNLILPYKNKYKFNIIISTEQNNDKNLDDKLKTIYNKYSQLNYVNYETLSRDKYKGHEFFGIRVAKVLEREAMKYDYYIFCRMDVVLLNPINLDDYINQTKLVSISGKNQRPGNTHLRDWDYIWLSDYKSLMTFMYPYMELNNTYKFKSEDQQFEKIYKQLDDLKNRDLTNKEILGLRNECGLDGDTSYMGHFKSVYLVLLNNCKFEFSSIHNIFSVIVR